MEDRPNVRGALWRGTPIELVVEDGFDRAVKEGVDLDGPLGGGLKALVEIGTRKPNDPQTGAKAKSWMRPVFRGSARTAPLSPAQSGWRPVRIRSIVQSA